MHGNFEHTVVAGETIYSIAKKYNQTTYQIKTSNNLPSNEVSIGQRLMIKGPRSVAAAMAMKKRRQTAIPSKIHH
jgi:peptidoglycan endopeptidase LytF